MQNTRSFFVNHVKTQCRYDYLSRVYYGSSIGNQGKFMQKIMTKNHNKRKWFIAPTNITPSIIHGKRKKELSGRRSRRMVVLDKLFMRYISDLMTTSKMSTELANRGVEISYVKVTSDYNLVNVYWIGKSDEHENSVPTEQLLHNCALNLRHELSQLRVIGVVPPIQFVKDKQYMLINEVERRLAIADFGNENESSVDPLESTQHISQTTKSEESSDFECESVPVEEDEENLYEVKLPEMRHDVLGLDHYKIMTKVKVSLDKARKSAQKVLDVQNESPVIGNSLATLNLGHQAIQDEMLQKFLNKRKVEERRKFKIKNANRTDPKMIDVDDNYYPNVLEDNYEEHENNKNMFTEDDT